MAVQIPGLEAHGKPVRGGVSRRTIVKGAAWSLPVIAASVSSPTYAASVPASQQDVIVSSGCYGFNILGFGQSFPQFTITAVGAPIKTGSTFVLSGLGLGNLSFGGVDIGFFNIVQGGGSAVVTLTADIPAGSSIALQVNGIASVQPLNLYTLAVQNIIGNADSNPANDSAAQLLSGSSLFGIFLGFCG